MLNCREGLTLCLVISIIPNALILSILLRARSSLQRSTKHFFNLSSVFAVPHINKIADNQTAKVAKFQLPCNFLCGLDINLKSGLFGIFMLSVLAAVYINRNKRFGLLDND